MKRTVILCTGCLLAVLLLAACGKSVLSLEVGDCFDDPSSFSGEVSEVDDVPCSQSHDNEVYAISDHPAGSDLPYPGENALFEYSNEYCLSEFDAYVGIDYLDSRLDFSYYYPGRDLWEDGDREIVCFIYDLDLAKLTKSMKGSRE